MAQLSAGAPFSRSSYRKPAPIVSTLLRRQWGAGSALFRDPVIKIAVRKAGLRWCRSRLGIEPGIRFHDRMRLSQVGRKLLLFKPKRVGGRF